MKIIFFVIIFFCVVFYSCNSQKLHSIEQYSNQHFDSVAYYKDVDYITLEGLGKPINQPFSSYPYVAFAYNKGTVELFIFFSGDHQSKLSIKTFLNGMPYYSTKHFIDGENIVEYNLFDRRSHKRIVFHGPIDSVLDGHIRQVEYSSSAGNQLLVDMFSGNFNSKKIPWQNIIERDSSFLHKSFCYYSNYIEEFAARTFKVISSTERYICAPKDSTVTNEGKQILASDISWPSLFYFMACKGDGFEDISN